MSPACAAREAHQAALAASMLLNGTLTGFRSKGCSAIRSRSSTDLRALTHPGGIRSTPSGQAASVAVRGGVAMVFLRWSVPLSPNAKTPRLRGARLRAPQVVTDVDAGLQLRSRILRRGSWSLQRQAAEAAASATPEKRCKGDPEEAARGRHWRPVQ